MDRVGGVGEGLEELRVCEDGGEVLDAVGILQKLAAVKGFCMRGK